MGDPSFYPLDESIEMRLKKLVDYNTWEKAKSYTKYYIRMKQQLAEASRYNQSYVQFSMNPMIGYNDPDLEPKRIEQI
jgi:acyl-CoA thioesterase